jgi:exopolyphosphatase/pppGpp-phosphohydrolase
LHNPGLDPRRVDTILGTCCLVVAVMRRLQLDRVVIGAA